MKVVKANITTLKVDAIVNAANSSLIGGGGVDGSIHEAAGPQLYEECRQMDGCETGDVKITKGYDLHAKFIIHTVGPIWRGGTDGEEKILAGCYRKALELALENGVKSIAFPSISTGVFKYPIELAARVAVRNVRKFIKVTESDIKVTFCCFSASDLKVYKSVLKT